MVCERSTGAMLQIDAFLDELVIAPVGFLERLRLRIGQTLANRLERPAVPDN